eukprot:1983861-Amphidinium_carterae.1
MGISAFLGFCWQVSQSQSNKPRMMCAADPTNLMWVGGNNFHGSSNGGFGQILSLVRVSVHKRFQNHSENEDRQLMQLSPTPDQATTLHAGSKSFFWILSRHTTIHTHTHTISESVLFATVVRPPFCAGLPVPMALSF